MSDVPPTLPAGSAAPARTSGLAITSLILGILACPLSFFAGIPGLICGILGVNKIARSERGGPGPRLTGRGLAIAGIILSSVGILATPVLVALLLPAVQAAREAALRATAMNELREVSFAMQMASDAFQGYPVDIVDGDGKPLLSWRVAILPFLGDEGKALFGEFHLDEPWDSDHNKALIPRMPAVYASAGTTPGQGLTGVILPAGPGSFGEPEGVMSFDDANMAVVKPGSVKDGLANTVCLMSVPGAQLPWTQPADWVKEPAELFALLRKDGVRALPIATGDGAARSLNTDLPDDTIRSIFSRAGDDGGAINAL